MNGDKIQTFRITCSESKKLFSKLSDRREENTDVQQQSEIGSFASLIFGFKNNVWNLEVCFTFCK